MIRWHQEGGLKYPSLQSRYFPWHFHRLRCRLLQHRLESHYRLILSHEGGPRLLSRRAQCQLHHCQSHHCQLNHPKPLHLRLSCHQHPLLLLVELEIAWLIDGTRGPAEVKNLCRRNRDIIIAVNGKSIVGKPFKEVIPYLKESIRFAYIRFVHKDCTTDGGSMTSCGNLGRYMFEDLSKTFKEDRRRSGN